MHDLGARTVFFVEDTPRAIEFYTDSLGFKLDWIHEENGRPYVVQLSLFGLQIILNQNESPTKGRAGHGRIFVGLDDEQSATILQHIHSRGIPAEYTEWGAPTMAIYDLDRNEIYFWLSDTERVKWQEAQASVAKKIVGQQIGEPMSTTESTQSAFEAVTPRIPVNDVERMLDFYTQMLGFNLDWKWGQPVTHASVCRGDVTLDLILVPEAKQGTAMAYVRIGGVDAYYSELESRGVQRSALEDRPYGMRDFEVVDPCGNRIAFGQALRS